MRGKRGRAKAAGPARAIPLKRAADTVAFTPPVPQELTDDEVLAALRRIPVPYQEVIVLCDVEEFTYKEIAAALRLPVGTVMSRLHRGRALLRRGLSAGSRAAPSPAQ